MSRYWSDLVNRLTPYVPGEQPRQPGLVKLNTNENPYPPSPWALEELSAVDGDDLRRYPDPESTGLTGAIAQAFGLSADQVFVGNGSDEVLALAFMALLRHDLPISFPDVSYSFYPVWCDFADIRYVPVPVADSLAVEVDAYPQRNGGIIMPNPNAPTGMPLTRDEVRRLLQRSPDSVVIIDEAYIDFGGESAACLVPEHDNLLVVQTLSKSRSLAGLRVGFALGDAALIEGLVRVKNSFNSYPLDVVAQRAARAAIEDVPYFQATCARVVASRERVVSGMTALGFSVLPSVANFIFASHDDYPAAQLFVALRERSVLVRYFDRPRIDNYLRISIGTEEECERLLAVLAEVLGKRA